MRAGPFTKTVGDWMDHSVVILAEVIFCSVPFLSCPSWRLPSFPSFLFLAMRYQLWYVRCDDPSSHGRLRVSPSDDVTKLVSGIGPMTQLFSEDMWLVDGFLKVHLQKDGPEYFVPGKHVKWSANGYMQSWKPLSDDMWFSTMPFSTLPFRLYSFLSFVPPSFLSFAPFLSMRAIPPT